jgi:hypothetical protein
MSYALARRTPAPLYPAGDVRWEYGWLDVQSGLVKMLQGYAVLIGGLAFCVFLIVCSVVQIGRAPAKLPMGSLWLFYFGISLPLVIMPLGYGLIVMGKWRCLMNAPERFHCRWLMFACMACLLMGPAINITSSLTGLQTAPELKRGPEGFRQMKFTRLGAGMQIASGVLGLGSLVLFVLFLRAIAKCFEARAQLWLTSLYLAFLLTLVGASVYAGFKIDYFLNRPLLLVGLGAAWLVVFLGYLLLIVIVRGCIAHGLSSMRSPLDPVTNNRPASGPASAPAAAALERAWPVV